MRLAGGIEYDGSRFLGWQIQRQEPTVQSSLQAALSRVADAPVTVTASGRTDTGVHAIEQVVHFDVGAKRSERSWVLGLNSNLPEGISALWVREVDEDFHARFSAVSRTYRYVIMNRRARPALQHGRVCWCPQPLDAEAMNEGALHLLGEHDFSAFRASACQARHPVREISAISVRRKDGLVFVDVTANAFLYHMVRNIAGSLIRVGKGIESPSWILSVLDSKDRDQAGPRAPADGLYFMKARYPGHFGLPERTPTLWSSGL